MKSNQHHILRIISYPIGWLYGLAVAIRNRLFDLSVLKSKQYKTAIISVGNITVGGTGKTPHIEMLIEMLRAQYKVAVLSRGYKRKTKGLIVADKVHCSASCLGDEPCQIYRKYPDVQVAVCKKRCQAIEALEKWSNPFDVFLLDDAYQHRYVHPGLSILLIDYSRPITNDHLLPYGNLRESADNRDRADILILTKCPEQMNAFESRQWRQRLNIKPYQQLYFTTMSNGIPHAVFAHQNVDVALWKSALVLTGIANPAYFEQYLKSRIPLVQTLRYPDHYTPSKKDWNDILACFNNLPPEDRYIAVTEKDAVKIRERALVPDELKPYIYEIPIKVSFLFDEGKHFEQKVMGYVEKNKRNSILFTQ